MTRTAQSMRVTTFRCVGGTRDGTDQRVTETGVWHRFPMADGGYELFRLVTIGDEAVLKYVAKKEGKTPPPTGQGA